MRIPSEAETAKSDQMIDEVARGDRKAAAQAKLASRVDSILEGCDELIATSQMVGTMSAVLGPSIDVGDAREVFIGLAVIMDDMAARIETVKGMASRLAYGHKSGGGR